MFGLNMGAAGGFFSLLIFLFLIVAAIAAVFVPFWVYRIRGEAIETNKLLEALLLNQGTHVICSSCHDPVLKSSAECGRCGLLVRNFKKID